MTVSNKPPIADYDGNGTQTVFAWDWDMIEDSSINVIVDNTFVTDWSLQAQTVVFPTAPIEGAAIRIYRRTKIWMPENYRAFGRFNSEKVELSVDRAMLIAQERNGTAVEGEPPNGIVGGMDLYTQLNPYDTTILSERGTDAVVPLWNGDGQPPPTPGQPDPSIIWAGADISGGIFSLDGNTNGVSAQIRFRMNFSEGEPDEASASYPNFNAVEYAGWVNVDPNDGEYWMRVTETGTPIPSNRYRLNDGTNNRTLGEAFPIAAGSNGVQGPYYSVYTFGDIAPSTRTAQILIEICKDFNGLPDENWASRTVKLEAIFNG